MKLSSLPSSSSLLPFEVEELVRGSSKAGNNSLLNSPLLGLIGSRKCPGSILFSTLDRVSAWIDANWVILSGFHSPVEKQVLSSTLRRNGRVVKVLARGMNAYSVPTEEREAFADGRMLVLAPFPPEVRRTTRATALERNRLIVALASELVVPHVSDGSPLAQLLEEEKARRSHIDKIGDGKGT